MFLIKIINKVFFWTALILFGAAKAAFVFIFALFEGLVEAAVGDSNDDIADPTRPINSSKTPFLGSEYNYRTYRFDDGTDPGGMYFWDE